MYELGNGFLTMMDRRNAQVRAISFPNSIHENAKTCSGLEPVTPTSENGRQNIAAFLLPPNPDSNALIPCQSQKGHGLLSIPTGRKRPQESEVRASEWSSKVDVQKWNAHNIVSN